MELLERVWAPAKVSEFHIKYSENYRKGNFLLPLLNKNIVKHSLM